LKGGIDMFDTENDLSNEQRAHDLALLAVQAEINRNLISQLNSGSKDVELDIYNLYFNSYKDALDAVTKDFG
jgi:cation transport regulator ChaB